MDGRWRNDAVLVYLLVFRILLLVNRLFSCQPLSRFDLELLK